jgi:hypothetical protein
MMDGEICVRRKVVIDGENYYLTIGTDFAHATTPFENRPENEKLREVVDMVCAVITETQGGHPLD